VGAASAAIPPAQASGLEALLQGRPYLNTPAPAMNNLVGLHDQTPAVQ
jgi:hypothetical protein